MIYSGPALTDGRITIDSTNADEILDLACDDDIEGDRADWLAAAQSRSDCVYFAVRDDGRVVGQIFLHDRDDERGESLIGYHIFRSKDRGRGIGATALGLLRDWALRETDLNRLVVITSEANIASRRTAESAGFRFVGRPQEDPVRGRVYEVRR